MRLTIFDVEHGACALVQSNNSDCIALIDCGINSTTGWTPGEYIQNILGKNTIDYLFITNADQDHYANLSSLRQKIYIRTFTKNPSLNADAFERIKRQVGPMSADALAYQALLNSHTHPVTTSFNDGMGGITAKTFYNSYPKFSDTNNLSLVTFINYNGFQILFPGDLERPGWLEMLANPEFRQELQNTTILVASHHGRQNGYCDELFSGWSPQAVVVSDKPIVHNTQNVPQYQNCISGDGINVYGQNRRRRVLTTRKDGAITFTVNASGNYNVHTNT
ncbi:MAG: hypothetical protein H6844_06530 [Alphaproteobacteria bacterium]|nr:hypothetical protein [Alphaproteobacteria bacterium]